MKTADFFRYLANDPANKRKLTVQAGVVVCLLVLNVVLLGYAIQQEVVVLAETEKSKQIVKLSADYEIEKADYDVHMQSDGGPVPKNKIDLVQSSLISFLEQARDLKVKSMTAKVNAETADKGKLQNIYEFEVSLIGSWENLMQLCHDLDNRAFAGQKVLIDIISIHLQNSDDNTKNDLIADITYDIYTD